MGTKYISGDLDVLGTIKQNGSAIGGGGSALYQHDIQIYAFKGDSSESTGIQARIINGVSSSQTGVSFYTFMSNSSFAQNNVLLGCYVSPVNQKGPCSITVMGSSVIIAGGVDENENPYFRYINGDYILTSDDQMIDYFEQDQDYADYWGFTVNDTVTAL